MKYYALFESAEEGGYIVSFPDLPGAYTQGDTLEEALAYAVEALDGWIESNFERNLEIPKAKEYKGKKYHAIEVSPSIAIALQLRKARGNRTQAEIAAQLNISQQTYCRLENPRVCNPTVKTLERISHVLGKPLHIGFG